MGLLRSVAVAALIASVRLPELKSSRAFITAFL
jgi:hypothetical protein